MKKIFLVLLIVLMLVGSGSATYQLSGTCIDRLCEICEKQITEWQESSPSFSGMYGSFGVAYCGGPQTTRLKIYSPTHYICDECASLYQEKYRILIIETEKKFISDAINESVKRRISNREINKAKALKKLLDQTKEIEKQIKELDRR